MNGNRDDVARCSEHEPFALRVTDDSMAPALPRGTVVVVDPGAPAVDGSYVVLAAQGGPLLCRLTLDGERFRSVRGDGANGPDDISREDIIGVVVQSAGRRRRDRRRHD